MTEIGVAQRQLIDDGSIDEPRPMAGPTESIPPGPQYGNEPHIGQMVQVEVNGVGYGNNMADATVIPALQPENDADISLSNYDQSNTSYNIFESLKGSSELNTGKSAGLDKKATHRSPRSKSMLAAPYSPHDTEPFSSMASPKPSRAKSDNAGSSGRSARCTGDTSASVEGPPKKKRGRKRKQTLEGQDNGPPNPDEYRTGEQNKTWKRKPSRPLSNAKAKEQDSNTPHHNQDFPTPMTSTEAKETSESNSVVPFDDVKNVPSKDDEMLLVEVDRAKDSAPAHSPDKEVTFVKPTKPASREPKKKLKRGKTTSVTLKKTYDSDVEDDVIWIDEKPLSPDLMSYESTKLTESPANTAKVEAQNNGSNAGKKDDKSSNLAPPEPDPPDPKKRGRKRKKTAEMVPESTTESNVQEQSLTTAEDTNANHETHPNSHDECNAVPASEEPPLNISPTKTQPPPEEPLEEPDRDREQTTPSTPKKPNILPTEPKSQRPTKHSPISGTSKVPYRVGLSRRARIAPLLRVVKR